MLKKSRPHNLHQNNNNRSNHSNNNKLEPSLQVDQTFGQDTLQTNIVLDNLDLLNSIQHYKLAMGLIKAKIQMQATIECRAKT